LVCITVRNLVCRIISVDFFELLEIVPLPIAVQFIEIVGEVLETGQYGKIMFA